MDNEELNKRVRNLYKNQRVKQKKKYDTAKSLGFSATEAMILQNQGWQTIYDLAKERGYVTNETNNG